MRHSLHALVLVLTLPLGRAASEPRCSVATQPRPWLPLNGVRDPAPWPETTPVVRILRTEADTLGIDWYVHEDGSRSTTLLHWRDDLGRMDAATVLARPVGATRSGEGAASYRIAVADAARQERFRLVAEVPGGAAVRSPWIPTPVGTPGPAVWDVAVACATALAGRVRAESDDRGL